MFTWFANRKTATKLISGFGFVLALFAFTGFFALERLAKVQDASIQISRNKLPSVQLLGDMQSAMWNYRGKELRHILLTDQDEMTKVEHLMDSISTVVATRAKAYEQLPYDVGEEEAWRQGWAAWQAYLVENQKVRQLSHSLRTEEARKAAMGTSLQKINEAATALQTDIEINRKGAETAREAAAEVYAGARRWVLIVMFASIVLGLAIALVLSRMIAAPLQVAAERAKKLRGLCIANLQSAMEKLAGGDLTATIQTGTDPLTYDAQDEVGDVARAINGIIEGTKGTVAAYEQAVGAMRGVLVEVRDSATSTASSSQQLTAAALEISSGAQEQASSLEETAASLEEMTATVKQNADNAQQAQQLAAGAREVADKGGRVVSDAVTAMREINNSSKKIADIITTIDEIAFQTNLLALNAAVEAARAGAQGRGFAVVAGEVRSLAQRSATAAKEIKSLIQDSVRKVEHGTTLVTDSGENLTEIVNSVKRVADIVSEIAAASKEQATGIDQVNKAVTQMDSVTQSNAGQTEELSGTAESLAQQAQELQQTLARFVLDAGGRAPVARAAAAAPARKAPARPAVKANGNGRAHSNGSHALPTGGRFAGNGASHAATATEAPSLPDLDDGFEEY